MCIGHSYLAIVAALATEADYMFCPESPPPENWEKELCLKLAQVQIIEKTAT